MKTKQDLEIRVSQGVVGYSGQPVGGEVALRVSVRIDLVGDPSAGLRRGPDGILTEDKELDREIGLREVITNNANAILVKTGSAGLAVAEAARLLQADGYVILEGGSLARSA